MEKQTKVLVLVIPAYGHFYPMISFINELTKAKNLKIIFTGNECDRNMIERSKAEYRNLECDVIDKNENTTEMKDGFPLDKLVAKGMEIFDMYYLTLLKIVEEEEIDLIIYDIATFHAKWFVRYLDLLYKKKKLKRKPPKAIMFCPSFQCIENLYPNKEEMKFFRLPKITLSFIIRMILFYLKYVFFHFKYDFKLESIIQYLFGLREDLNLCCVFPELQPRSHLFPKSVKFIGNCVCKCLNEIFF